MSHNRLARPCRCYKILLCLKLFTADKARCRVQVWRARLDRHQVAYLVLASEAGSAPASKARMAELRLGPPLNLSDSDTDSKLRCLLLLKQCDACFYLYFHPLLGTMSTTEPTNLVRSWQATLT
eukprot:6181821-Pleurochrysis_carterae.AAC.3